MAKVNFVTITDRWTPPGGKKTSQGRKNIKMSSMNKHKKRGYKKYRGQGR